MQVSIALSEMKVLSFLRLNPRKASLIHKIRSSQVHMYVRFVFILTKLTMKEKSTIINDYMFNILSILIRFDIL
jgi:hypothetical protein